MERRSKSTSAIIFLSSLALLLALLDTKADAFRSAFFHNKSFGGYEEPYVGQTVSFVFEEGPKGAAATKVKEEKGGIPVEEAPFQEEREREMGTVKVCLTTALLLLGTVGRPCCSYNLD